MTKNVSPYYKQIAEHLGTAARFQVLADFLGGQKIPELEGVKVPAIRGKLGGQKFYCFLTAPRQLLKIAFINHRALDDPKGHPAYQRLVSKQRLKQIGDYINKGGFFSTNFLINFNTRVRFDMGKKELTSDEITYGTLYMPDRYKSAWVIDGQHRFYGFTRASEAKLNENIVVIAFENLPTRREADLFVTINHEQRVSRRAYWTI